MLAGVETQKYAEWDKKHKADIENARNRAIARYNEHFKNISDKKQAEKEENVFFKLFRKNGWKSYTENLRKLPGISFKEKDKLWGKDRENSYFLRQT